MIEKCTGRAVNWCYNAPVSLQKVDHGTRHDEMSGIVQAQEAVEKHDQRELAKIQYQRAFSHRLCERVRRDQDKKKHLLDVPLVEQVTLPSTLSQMHLPLKHFPSDRMYVVHPEEPYHYHLRHYERDANILQNTKDARILCRESWIDQCVQKRQSLLRAQLRQYYASLERRASQECINRGKVAS